MGQKMLAGIVWCKGCEKPTLKDVAHKHGEHLYCLKCFQHVRPDTNGESVFGET